MNAVERAELREYFHEQVGPLIRSVLSTEIDQGIEYDRDAWQAFVEALSIDIVRDMLWGPDSQGPYCKGCKDQGILGEFDENHEFSPEYKGGMPPCLCGHRLEVHSKGEQGKNHPQYWAIEGFQRMCLPDENGNSFFLNPKNVRSLWTLMLDFEKYKSRAIEKFKVRGPHVESRKVPEVPPTEPQVLVEPEHGVPVLPPEGAAPPVHGTGADGQ